MTGLVRSFTVEALKPKYMGLQAARISCPEFHQSTGDWQNYFQCLTQIGAGVGPLLSIARSDWFSQIPEVTRLMIDERISRERFMLSLLDHELDSVLFSLIGSAVPFVILDGMDLGHRYYPERLFRPCSVVDILIPEKAFETALTVLAKADYRVSKTDVHNRLLMSRGSRAPLLRLSKDVYSNASEAETEQAFLRASCPEFSGLPMNSKLLSFEDLFIRIVDKFKRSNNSPVLFNDLHFLLQRSPQDCDWDNISWTLAKRNSLYGAWYVLNLLSSSYQTKIPAESLVIFETRIGVIRKRLIDRLLANKPADVFTVQSTSRRFYSKLLLSSRPVTTFIDALRSMFRNETANGISAEMR